MISSIFGLFVTRGRAQSPTPIDILEFGKDFLNPFARGIATRTSPKSLFLNMNIFLIF
jgi:hypothetical protein